MLSTEIQSSRKLDFEDWIKDAVASNSELHTVSKLFYV